MSESLLFAILGFLTACLIGTVFASFLWRRAVTVTTRRITEDENFAGLDQVANLRADLRNAQDLAAANANETEQAQVRAADLEAALAEAQASGEGTVESLRQEVKTAAETLKAAEQERDAAKAALKTRNVEIKASLAAKDAELVKSQERSSFLENAIRTLAQEASLLKEEPLKPEPAITPTQPPKASAGDELSVAPDAAGSATSPQKTPEENEASSESRIEPSLAVSRSLEERIEALKQGETPPSR